MEPDPRTPDEGGRRSCRWLMAGHGGGASSTTSNIARSARRGSERVPPRVLAMRKLKASTATQQGTTESTDSRREAEAEAEAKVKK